jgi:hypothetical protein
MRETDDQPQPQRGKEAAVRVARPGCVYSVEEPSYYERNQDWYIHRDYNRVVQPIDMPTEYSFQINR